MDMKNLKLLILSALLFQPAVFAGAPTWKEKCSDWKACVENFSVLTGEQYLYTDIVAKMSFTENLPFEKEDADLIFTSILNQNGLARVALKPNVYEILRQNDAKGKDLPHVECDQRNAPKLPDTYDLVIMEYQFTNPVLMREVENMIRTYSNMGTRIYGVESSGKMMIVEVAKDLNKIYRLLVSADIKPTATAMLKAKAENKDDRGGEHGNKPPKKDDKKP